MSLAAWISGRLAGNGERGTRKCPSTLVVIAVVTVMLTTHFLEIVTWAAFFFLTGIVPGADAAMYFSINSYSTLGASGIVLEDRWRGIAGIETMVAMLMFGWSTAVLVSVVQKLDSADK